MNAVAQFQPARLPWNPVIEERFGDMGVTKTSWKALTEAVWPGAKTIDGVALALSYCQARNLDPFKKPVHIVPVWSSSLGREVEGVWPGISELRTTAMRTGEYAGCDETEFGPDITRDFEWSDKKGPHKATVTFPEWARMTTYRMVGGYRAAFVGPKVYWLETYATAKRDTDAPNDMWRKRPRGQIDKCCEAAALRKTFPEELGNEYAAEEMSGRVVGVDGDQAPILAPKVAGLHSDFDDAPVDAEVEEIVEAVEDAPDPTPSAEPAEQATATNTDGSKTGAQAGNPATDTSGPSATSDASPSDPDEWTVLENHEGPAPTGVVYLLAGDEINKAGKVPTYMDGEPFSTVGQKGAAQLPQYTEHPTVEQLAPVEAEPAADFPGDRQISASPEDRVEPEGGFLAEMRKADSWFTIKAHNAALGKTPEWIDADDDMKDEMRRAIWGVVVEMKKRHRDPVDQATDASAFRLWITTMTGKDGADAIEGTLGVLKDSPAWAKLTDGQQQKLVADAMAHAQKIRGA